MQRMVVAVFVIWTAAAVQAPPGVTGFVVRAQAVWSEPQERQPPRVDEFVPISELPPDDKLPAAPLLIAAYAFVWLAVFAYVFSVWRRLTRVERELAEVAQRMSTRDRRA